MYQIIVCARSVGVTHICTATTAATRTSNKSVKVALSKPQNLTQHLTSTSISSSSFTLTILTLYVNPNRSAHLIVRRRAVLVDGRRLGDVGAWLRVLRHRHRVGVVEDGHLVVRVLQVDPERYLGARLLVRLRGSRGQGRSGQVRSEESRTGWGRGYVRAGQGRRQEPPFHPIILF